MGCEQQLKAKLYKMEEDRTGHWRKNENETEIEEKEKEEEEKKKEEDQKECEEAAEKDLEPEFDGEECKEPANNNTSTTTTPAPSNNEAECLVVNKVEPTDKVDNKLPKINSNKTDENNDQFTVEHYLDFETRCKCIKSTATTSTTTSTSTTSTA